MSIKNHTDLNSGIDSSITDNQTGDITGPVLNQQLKDIADSSVNKEDYINDIPAADTDTTGLLSSSDWNTFNSKQAALGFTLENVANKATGTGALTTSDTTYPSENKVRANLGFVTPEMYGAVGNGSTDDSAAIQNAFNSGNAVFFGIKNYRVNSSIVLADNARAYGQGKGSIISTTSNIAIFDVQGSYCSIEDLTFLGNSTGATQRGIQAIGNGTFTLYRLSNIISKCRFESMGGAGLYCFQIIGLSGGVQHQGAFYLNNCVATSCLIGYHLDDRAEYNSLTNCFALACTTGVTIKGGNNTWSGGQITDNTTGISILGGTNDGHGSITGCKINHNTTNVSISGLSKNFIFNACDIYVGAVTLGGAIVKFIGCEFSTNNNISQNTSTVQYIGCTFFTALSTSTFLNATGIAPTGYGNIFAAGNTSLWLQYKGSATLASGTVTVSNGSVTANSMINLTVTTATNQGNLRITKTAGTGFTITSSNASDSSIVDWELIPY